MRKKLLDLFQFKTKQIYRHSKTIYTKLPFFEKPKTAKKWTKLNVCFQTFVFRCTFHKTY